MLANSHTDRLKETAFFGSLPDAIFAAVVTEAKTLNLTRGQSAFRQGEPSNAVFYVAEGAVKLTVLGKGGREVVVDILEAGCCFSEALLFRHGAYPFSAVALSPSLVIAVPKARIESELQTDPDAIATVLSAGYAHLHRLLRQIELLKASSGLQRVADFLLTLSEQNPGRDRFEIPYEKQTVASMLGIKPETLSRSFRRLASHGVRVVGPTVEVSNRAALQTFISEG